MVAILRMTLHVSIRSMTYPANITFDDRGITNKDYKRDDPERQHVMILIADEFIRRLLLNVGCQANGS